MRFSSLRDALAFSFSISLLATTTPAMAEPPMMKEQSVRPRIEARSKDGRYSVALGGFLQGRYTLVARDFELESSSFDTPRTRLYAFGHVHSPNVRYRLMLGTPASSIHPELYDAYVDFRATDAIGFRAGRFKIPVFREWVETARMLASVERTSLTQTVAPGRSYGVLASGELFATHVDYAVGVFNGVGRISEAGAAVESPVVAGRAAWNLMGRSIEGEVDFLDSPRTVVVGLSGYTTLDPARATAGGFEMAYRGHGLDVTLELMGQSQRTTTGSRTVAGLYARADRYVPSLRSGFGARATRIVGADAPELTRTELELDAAYYAAEHDLKIVANVGLARRHEARAWEPFVMVQAQAAF